MKRILSLGLTLICATTASARYGHFKEECWEKFFECKNAALKNPGSIDDALKKCKRERYKCLRRAHKAKKQYRHGEYRRDNEQRRAPGPVGRIVQGATDTAGNVIQGTGDVVGSVL